MIISLDRIKLLAMVVAILIIPVIGWNLINKCLIVETAAITSDMVTSINQTNDISPLPVITDELKGSGFLTEYRLERARVRSKEFGLLQDIVGNPESTANAREAAYLKLVDLIDREEKELQAETLIKSQGYQDCAVVITAGGTTVMLKGGQTGQVGQENIIKTVSLATGNNQKSIAVIKIDDK